MSRARPARGGRARHVGRVLGARRAARGPPFVPAPSQGISCAVGRRRPLLPRELGAYPYRPRPRPHSPPIRCCCGCSPVDVRAGRWTEQRAAARPLRRRLDGCRKLAAGSVPVRARAGRRGKGLMVSRGDADADAAGTGATAGAGAGAGAREGENDSRACAVPSLRLCRALPGRTKPAPGPPADVDVRRRQWCCCHWWAGGQDARTLCARAPPRLRAARRASRHRHRRPLSI